MKKSVFLILLAVLTMLSVSVVFVFAQDVDNMSNEELRELLQQIMQKLDQSGEATETPEPTPTPTPAATNTPRPELSDDKADLEALMTTIMQKLQQKETPAPETVPTDEPPKDPAPTATMIPLLESESMGISIYENKKLIIEELPGYMFIQPTKDSKPEKETHSEKDHYYGEPCSRPDVTNRDCFWVDWDGTWACKCPRG